jgi:hypothetical protein
VGENGHPPLRGLESTDPVVGFSIHGLTLVDQGKELVLRTLTVIDERANYEWDLVLLAVPMGKGKRVLEGISVDS